MPAESLSISAMSSKRLSFDDEGRSEGPGGLKVSYCTAYLQLLFCKLQVVSCNRNFALFYNSRMQYTAGLHSASCTTPRVRSRQGQPCRVLTVLYYTELNCIAMHWTAPLVSYCTISLGPCAVQILVNAVSPLRTCASKFTVNPLNIPIACTYPRIPPDRDS